MDVILNLKFLITIPASSNQFRETIPYMVALIVHRLSSCQVRPFSGEGKSEGDVEKY